MDAARVPSVHCPFMTLSRPSLRLSPMRIAVLFGALLAAVRFVGFAPLTLLDDRTVDLRLMSRGVQPASPEVVIVAVDNKAESDDGFRLAPTSIVVNFRTQRPRPVLKACWFLSDLIWASGVAR